MWQLIFGEDVQATPGGAYIKEPTTEEEFEEMLEEWESDGWEGFEVKLD